MTESLFWDSTHRAYRELSLSSPEEDWETLFPWEVFVDPLPRSPMFSQEGWIRKVWCIFLEFIHVTHAVGSGHPFMTIASQILMCP